MVDDNHGMVDDNHMTVDDNHMVGDHKPIAVHKQRLLLIMHIGIIFNNNVFQLPTAMSPIPLLVAN
jgi:hypothetical protein